MLVVIFEHLGLAAAVPSIIDVGAAALVALPDGASDGGCGAAGAIGWRHGGLGLGRWLLRWRWGLVGGGRFQIGAFACRAGAGLGVLGRRAGAGGMLALA
jgi:hypothetical protein